MSLQKGAISKILSLGSSTAGPHMDFQPILEVIELKKMADGKSEKWQMILSDGSNDRLKAVLATQIAEKANSGEVHVNGLVRLLTYIVNDLPGGGDPKSNIRKMMIILGIEGVGTVPSQNIDGSPSRFNINQNTSFGYRGPETNPSLIATPSTYGINSIASSIGTPFANDTSYSNPGRPVQQPSYISPYGGMPQQPNNPLVNDGYGGGGYAYGGQSNSRPVVRDSGDLGVVPISALNPYSNKWVIKARVTAKSEIRRFSNAKGDGCLFSIDLLDSSNGEVRGTFFNQVCCDKFYNLLAVGRVYFLSGGRLKVANKKYSNLKNDYEITFDERSEIRDAPDDQSISAMNFSFVKIGALHDHENKSTVDVLAIVKHATDAASITSTKLGGRQLIKRELTIVDDSMAECRITLWGDKAQESVDWASQPIVAFKRVMVSDYGGRSLGTGSSSHIEVNPNIPEAHLLHQWKLQNASNGDVSTIHATSVSGGGAGAGGRDSTSLSARGTIAAIYENGMGRGEKADYINLKGSITHIFHDKDPWYNACPTCKKKVVETLGQGTWMCEKCGVELDKPDRRYLINMKIADETGDATFTVFNDEAVALLGRPAEDLHNLKLSGDEASLEAVFTRALFTPITLTSRIKSELVSDEQKLKCTIASVKPLDFSSECSQLIDAIARYEGVM